MNIAELNGCGKEKGAEIFKACCGSSQWVAGLSACMPFADEQQLMKSAEEAWYGKTAEKDWLEAFTHHPKIGDVKSLAEKFASTAHLAGNEQKEVLTADSAIIKELAACNESYEKKNGFIFIVSATGKSASEMLRLLKDRLSNSREEELRIAMGEQHKITILRLKNSIEGDWSAIKGSQITTHVLDTALGKPAAGITIALKEENGQVISQGVTNSDGRIPDLLPPGRTLPAGHYKMVFSLDSYYAAAGTRSFYPMAEIVFRLSDAAHYHIPLLLSPFGYSTYRGS